MAFPYLIVGGIFGTIKDLIIVLRNYLRRDIKLFSRISSVGVYSLGMYIVHVSLRNLMGTMEMELANPLVYGICILVSVPISIAVS